MTVPSRTTARTGSARRRGRPRLRVLLGAALVGPALVLGATSPLVAGEPGHPGRHGPHGQHGDGSPVRGKPAASAAVPDVSGPIAVDDSLSAEGGVTSVDASVLDAAGYQVKEHVVSGRASAFRFTETPGTDGAWKTEVEPGSATDYRTRVLVFSPKDPRRFSGTVITEWNNVTRGADAMPDIGFSHTRAFRAGDVWVGVSAQWAGVESAKRYDPATRGTLLHPGDSYSYDIFSQAGMAVRERYRELLGGLRPRTVIADGESQSAVRLQMYIGAVTPLHHVYDAYLVHSRVGASNPIQQPPYAGGTTQPPPVVQTPDGPRTDIPDGNVGRSLQLPPNYAKSRTDLVEPVIYVMSETDVYAPPDGVLDYGPATQPHSRGFRLWEVAGTAHIDACVTLTCRTDRGDLDGAVAQLQDQLTPPPTSFGTPCTQPINAGQHGYVLSAAMQNLIRWARTGGARGGVPAPAPPLFAGQQPGQPTGTVPQRDAHGNILGGVRTPAVDVPVATLDGRANDENRPCLLAGNTTPFSAEKLGSLYPSQRAYVRAYVRSVDQQVRRGFLTRADGELMKRAATRVRVVPAG